MHVLRHHGPVNMDRAQQRIRYAYGNRIASCIHIAAYFDLTGEEHPAFEAVTIEGTKQLLQLYRG